MGPSGVRFHQIFEDNFAYNFVMIKLCISQLADLSGKLRSLGTSQMLAERRSKMQVTVYFALHKSSNIRVP
jgi:hypothetical protein